MSLPATLQLDNNIDIGTLNMQITSTVNPSPIEGAAVNISYIGVPQNTLEQLTTNTLCQTASIELATPPLESRLDATSNQQPYSEYTLEINPPEFNSIKSYF